MLEEIGRTRSVDLEWRILPRAEKNVPLTATQAQKPLSNNCAGVPSCANNLCRVLEHPLFNWLLLSRTPSLAFCEVSFFSFLES